MIGLLQRRALALGLCVFAGCHEDAPRMPPPLPKAPVPVAVAEAHEATPLVQPEVAPIDRVKRRAGAGKPLPVKPRHDKPAPREERAPVAQARERALLTPAKVPAPLPVPMPAPMPAPQPAPSSRPPALTKEVVVPRTPHVRAELPSGLQADLDADPRMQSWVNRVIDIADTCHAKDRSARGTIAARVTMHENERPDVDLRNLPGALSSVVACATGSLMRTKMPLFTGREGSSYDVRIVFE
jgi:hypothetical protein